MAHQKSLSVYYSRKGNNYVSGSIVNLPIGNTEVIANKIQGLTGSDLFQIQTVTPYPDDYTATIRVAQDELTEMVAAMDSYEVIYLGYPSAP